jgi:hypothetical protein
MKVILSQVNKLQQAQKKSFRIINKLMNQYLSEYGLSLKELNKMKRLAK